MGGPQPGGQGDEGHEMIAMQAYVVGIGVIWCLLVMGLAYVAGWYHGHDYALMRMGRHIEFPAKCSACGQTWTAIAPTDIRVTGLECRYCHMMEGAAV